MRFSEQLSEQLCVNPILFDEVLHSVRARLDALKGALLRLRVGRNENAEKSDFGSKFQPITAPLRKAGATAAAKSDEELPQRNPVAGSESNSGRSKERGTLTHPAGFRIPLRIARRMVSLRSARNFIAMRCRRPSCSDSLHPAPLPVCLSLRCAGGPAFFLRFPLEMSGKARARSLTRAGLDTESSAAEGPRTPPPATPRPRSGARLHFKMLPRRSANSMRTTRRSDVLRVKFANSLHNGRPWRF